MKQLFFIAIFFSLATACSTDSSSTKTSSSDPSGKGTTFNDQDVVNEVKGGLANSSQKQVDLKNIVRGKNPAEEQKLLSVDQVQSLFPDGIGDMSIMNRGGETNSILSAPATFVKNEYRNGNQVARINFTDTGGSPRVLVGIANWSNQVINKDEKQFYERTRTFGGFPAYERVIRKSNANNFEYIIDNRWIFAIQSLNMPIEKVHEIAGFLNPNDLRKLGQN